MMMRKLKLIFVVAMLVILTALLAGCGANVSTTMTVDTVDDGFAGSRVMTLLIENDDLTKVTGGITALETVIKESKPADLSYAISYPSDSQTQITFTLAFTSLDDYKDKVGKILAANANNTIVSEIQYEKNETAFRKGLKFEENFETIDLLKWYENAIAAANIISEDRSNWYEKGSSELIVDGTTLNTYGNKFDYDKVDTRYLSGCEVRTVMNVNGTYDRTITLYANQYNLERLNEVNEDFAGYMKSIATEGITYTTETDADSGKASYIYTISGASAEELVAKTNAVLQTPDNVFSVAIAPKEGVLGTAQVVIQEDLNGSYYMDADYYSISSTIVTYPNFRLTEGNANTNYHESELYYNIHGNEEPNTLTGNWLVGYEQVELKLNATSAKKLSAELVFQASDALPAEIRDIAFSALETASKDNATFSKDGNAATCKFTGTADEVAKKLNGFVQVYAPAQEGEDTEYCQVFLKELATASKFTNGLYGTVDINLSPVLGNTKVYVSSESGTKIANQLDSDDIGTYTDSNIAVRFYAVNLNFVTLILTVLFVIVLLGGAALAILHREGFGLWITDLKAKFAKPAPVEVCCPQDDAQPQQEQYYAPQQEVPQQEALQQETPAQNDTEEDEEEIL